MELSCFGVGGLWGDRQIYREGAAFFELAFDVDSAVVPDDDFLYDCQAQTSALDLFAGAVDAIESAKNFIQVIFRYSHTGIGNFDDQLIIDELGGYRDNAVFGSEFDSVINQVGNHRVDFVFVAEYFRQILRNISLQPDFLFACDAFERFSGVFCDRGDVDGFTDDFDCACLYLGNVEDSIDEVGEPVGFLIDDLQEFLPCWLCHIGVIVHCFGVCLYRRQRGAQLVGNR